MKGILKRTLSSVLAASMLVSLAPMAFAEEQMLSGASEISFSAAKYNVSENEKKLKVKIVREGGNDREIDVAFKAADFTAEYGVDYTVADADGIELEAADGIAPDESEFEETSDEGVAEESADETAAVSEEIADEVESANENGDTSEAATSVEEPDVSDDGQQDPEAADGLTVKDDGTVGELGSVLDGNDTDTAAEEMPAETASTEEGPAEEAPAEDVYADSVVAAPEGSGQRVSTGSSLLDAQAQYLQLPDDDAETSAAVETILNDINGYFRQARGAVGVVHFDAGETEKEITIDLIDNDLAQADKIVLLSLMGVNGDDDTSLAANPTAYVNIMDDEEYETPVIMPNIDEIRLSQDAPECELVLSRTEGVDYYTSVLISTVKDTAQEGYNYEKIENASVAFAPGETEKRVKISAANFSDEMSFGIRLESDGTCEITNEYIPVVMEAAPAAESPADPDVTLMSADGNVELMAQNVIGSAETNVNLNQYSWDKIYDGGNDHWADTVSAPLGFDLRAQEKDKGHGIGWRTRSRVNFYGIDSVSFHMYVGGSGSKGFNSYFELHSAPDFHGGDGLSRHVSGKMGWTKLTNNLNNGGEYYIKVKTIAKNAGVQNPLVQLGNPLTYSWHKYTFNVYNQQVFNRLEYDYADGTGEAMKIAYTDGKDDYDYIPSVKLVTDSGSEVNGFYANANQRIKPVSLNPELDEKYGVELEGVYLYTKDTASLYRKDSSYPYTDHWYSDNTIWIPASGITADQALAEQIQKKLGKVSEIKVTPKFKQKTVTLQVHTVDDGKTYIANMDRTTEKEEWTWHWLLPVPEKVTYDYGTYEFPVYSTIKVRAVAAPEMTITGFNIDLWSQPTSNDPIYANDEALERMTYTLTENMSFYPRTEKQGMNVAYMPGADTVVDDLEGRVFAQPSIAESTKKIQYSDANGDLNIQTVYPGMIWTLRATAPDGYYVRWTNGTGDIKNVNGRIDVSSDPNINEETENTRKFQNLYVPVYGDIMSGTIQQNNTKYYYEFVKNGNSSGRVWGKVLRENGSFYDIVYNKSLERSPASATQVSVAGTSGFTDGNGDFSIELNNVPTSGLVSVIVDDNGTMYPTTALANYMSITLPAYEVFKPQSLSVIYEDSTANKINGTAVNIKDDTLNITAQVSSSGSIQPVAAKFYIHKVNGSVIDCSTDSRFENSFANGTAIMSFNPKSVMDSGDKIYVAFIDQNGKEYKSLDLGYTFVAPLDLRTFAFPLIGSSLLENAYSSAVELIGDPLGDVALGSIGFDEPETDTVTPDGMDPTKYNYIMSTYKFGDYSKALTTFSSDGGGDDDGKDASEETADKTKDAVNDAGKETDGGGYKTAKSFSWEFSPKAAFAMQLTTRQVDGQYKYFFEELDFLVGLDYDVSGKITITLPIGMNVIITGSLSGDVTGIFQLKTNYTGDSTWDKNKVEYSTETFGLFEEIDNVDRKAYLMLNPTISLGLGVEIAIIEVGGNANFKFDMDFEFGLNAGSLGHRMYGDMTYNFDYYIKVLSIKVYSGQSKEQTVELFSENADGHIEPDIIAGLMSVEGDEIQSEPTTREYLANTSAWNGAANMISLMDIDAENTEETELQHGVYPSSKTTLTSLGNGKLFMTFIGDVEERSDINRTGLFYTIYDGTEWSQPALIEDDGTLDDYPDVFDLGDRLLISWSSADRVLDDNTTAPQALTALDIKTVFFDKASETFSEVTQLTHTTDEDYTADVEPKAAYDSETDRLILYYTKTEYFDAETLTDLTNAPSVIAYRFYENGAWNDGTSYTDDELAGVSDPEQYRIDWYGQRFLDIRLDASSSDMLRIVDSDAISYNGLALYAWTVDYDKDLNTTEDRDIFVQIYNFSENSFTHIIRITPDTGSYSTPHFGRYGDDTYLFYSSVGELDESGDTQQSGIAYIELSKIIRDQMYTLVTEGSTQYYILEYTDTTEESVNSGGETIPAQEITIRIEPTYAVTIDGYINNYSVDVDSDERMYLTWTDSDENGSRQVYTSIYDAAPQTGAGPDTDGDIDMNYDWSEAFKLTNAENTAYGNFDAAVIDGKLYIAASKTPYTVTDENTSLDEANASLVTLVHTPYSKPVTAESNALVTDTKYVYPDTGFTLTSTVKNEGTNFIDVPVTFRFTMTSNGAVTELGTQTVEGLWGAGKSLSAYVDVPAISEISDDLTFNAEITVGEGEYAETITQELKAVKEYNIIPDGDAVLEELTAGHNLNIPLKNDGNIPSSPISVKLYTAKDGEPDELIEEYTLDNIPENSNVSVDEIVYIPDDAYVIDGDDGTADIIAVIEADGEEVTTLETTAHRTFDSEAIETMSKVTDVSIKGDDKISAEYLDDIEIETEIGGTAGDEVTILWVSDDTDVVYVRSDNTLCAIGNGTAQLTGYVVPSEQNIVFSYDGTSSQNDMLSMIPSTLYKSVTAEVTVTGAEEGPDASASPEPTRNPNRGGGGGSGISRPTASPSPSSTPDATETPDSESSMFNDVSGHWAEEYIERLAADGIVSGMGNGLFVPDGNITRAQFAQILMNTELVSEGDIEVPVFTDVSPDAWYFDAVKWAVSCGVAKGMGDGTFEPETLITREQMAAMVNRFITLAGISAQSAEAPAFTDAENISDWAVEDVNALAAIGIINGRDTGEFDPKANMTRAEGTVVICNIFDAKEVN